MSDLRTTPLNSLHKALGAKMVPFAGYEMPVQYPAGILKEHLWTRGACGLFDVSHMGQVRLAAAEPGYLGIARAFEALVPSDAIGLGEGRQRYGFLTTASGGVLDDLMFANKRDHMLLVVNAACKRGDIEHLKGGLGGGAKAEEITGRGLIALQGPKAEAALARLNPDVRDMRFMDAADMRLDGAECWISRSGYTGEDGYEISAPEEACESIARLLLDMEEVAPAGLGARDSLRLEAGLCLHGSDLDETTSPVEAGLAWAIQNTRRQGGEREGGFPGADRILRELAEPPARRRVGFRPEGRIPMRERTAIYETPDSGREIGSITSGGFGPSVEGPVAMGYIDSRFARSGLTLYGEVRGKRHAVKTADLPFVPAGFKR